VGITNGEGDLADADTLADSDLTSDGDGPGRDAPYFSTCQQYLDHNPGAADGEVTLYVDHNPALAWTAHCADMAFGPKEFLTLVRTGNEVNFAQYTASIVAGGTDVRTLYTRLRLDPTSLEVDTGDQTFSSTSGHITQGGKVIKSMPYGVAAGCGNVLDRGEAQIDLRGTPFKVTDTFVPRGARPNGAATFSHDDQVVDIWGVGRCGWVAPLKTAYSPVNRRGGTLQLAHIRE
jgi:hypothetical protein